MHFLEISVLFPKKYRNQLDVINLMIKNSPNAKREATLE